MALVRLRWIANTLPGDRLNAVAMLERVDSWHGDTRVEPLGELVFRRRFPPASI